MRRFLFLLPMFAVACSDASTATTQEGDYTSGDYAEDMVLPYSGGWLDPPKALGGVGQFDRLHATIHDDTKCSTMVGLAAAIVGGEDRFTRFVDETARRRAGHADDLAIIEKVRDAVAQKKLTPRHLHELTEAVARAFGVIYGAFDEQIRTMVEASGYTAVHVGSTKPHVLVDDLAENEVVPLGVVSAGIPHITLLWKDAHGTVRLYDSDDIGHGVHVLPRGSALYNVRLDAADSSWDLAEKYR